MESILTSIKKLLGIAEEYTHFDTDLIMHINSVFLILTSHNTHQAVHYGNEDLLIRAPVERSKNDTCPWKRK